MLHPLTLVMDEPRYVNILLQNSMKNLVHFYKGLKVISNLSSEGCCQFVFATGVSGFLAHFLWLSNNLLYMQSLPTDTCTKDKTSLNPCVVISPCSFLSLYFFFSTSLLILFYDCQILILLCLWSL